MANVYVTNATEGDTVSLTGRHETGVGPDIHPLPITGPTRQERAMGAKIEEEKIEAACSALWEEIGDGLTQNQPPDALRAIVIKILVAAGYTVEEQSRL